jgi:hypothetical protein
VLARGTEAGDEQLQRENIFGEQRLIGLAEAGKQESAEEFLVAPANDDGVHGEEVHLKELVAGLEERGEVE